MYDYFNANLTCPRCGNASGPRARINMQTHIRDDADGSTLEVGYEFDASDLKEESILSSSYSLIRPPDSQQAIRVLNIWRCPSCRTDQWAVVEIMERKIIRIEAVSMSRAVLEEANFIGEVNAELLAATLIDIPSRELSERKLDVVTVLRQHLR
jgi:hypothetical protein